MSFKFIVTAPIVPFEVGQEVEFEEMPHQGMLHRLKAVEGKELVVATPQTEPQRAKRGSKS